MSYFCANSIRISKDKKSYQVKGGDNNLVPRSNFWTNDIPIDTLLYNIVGGGIQFVSRTNPTMLLIEKLVFEYNEKWGGDWNDATDLWHSLRSEDNDKANKFNEEFLTDLFKQLKQLNPTKKNYVIYISDRASYVQRFRNRQAWLTYSKDNAKKFHKLVALEKMKGYDNAEIKEI